MSGPDRDDEEDGKAPAPDGEGPGPAAADSASEPTAPDNPFKVLEEAEGEAPPPAEDEGHILTTAEPFHPARDDDDGDDDGGPLPPPPIDPYADLGKAGPDAEPESEAAPEAVPPPTFEPEAPPPPPRGGWWARLARRVAMLLVFFLFIGPVLTTLVYRFVPPPLTMLMLIRLTEGHGIDHRWRPLSRISPNLTRAVIGAEDSAFCQHHGFDFAAMQKAMAHNEKRPGRIRGGSTISQQTAKNVFLWPDRSYVRKGFEAWFTVLIETLWGKRRIMEVYLNSIEWGPGVYGAEAAAQANFGIPAAKLSPVQAARLAAILPRPLKWQADTPGRYVASRSRRIGAAEGTIDRAGLDNCVE